MKKNNSYFMKGIRLVSLLLISSSLNMLSSCSYDDDDLRTSIDNLDDRLSSLENSVAKMNAEVDNIKIITEALSEKGFVESLTKDENGNVLVKYSTGKETLIAIGQDAVSPIITIKEEDGIYFWAKEVNGSIEFLLDGNNNKMPVSGITPQIRINSISKEWETSIDNGKTWQSTGVVASVDGSSVSAFESVEEDDDYVYFNLTGGTQIKIEKTKDLSLIIIGGPQYFKADETKVVTLQMKGVFKYALSKPDGWKVSITTKGLSITSPSEANEYAETAGLVSITAVSEGGKSIIAQIKVQIGEAPLSIKVVDDNVEISNSNPRYSYFAGVCEASKFSEDYINNLLIDNIDIYRQSYAYEGAVSGLKGDPVEAGINYIIWAVQDKGFYDPDIESLTGNAYYKEPDRSVSLQTISIKSTDASFKVDMINCEQYYIGVVQGLPIEEIMNLVTGYDKNKFLYSSSEVKLSELNNDWGYPVKCSPSSSYTVWAAPFKTVEYTADDFVLVDISLLAPDYTGTAKVMIDNVSPALTSYKATITPDAFTSGFYYSHKSKMDMEYLPSDIDVINSLMNGGDFAVETTVKEQSWLEPETTYYLCAVSVDADGKIGPLVKQEITTKTIEYTGTASVKFSAKTAKKGIEFNLEPSGNVKEYKYMTYPKGELPYGVKDDSGIKNYVVLGNYPVLTIAASDIENNVLNIGNLQMDTEYDFYMVVIDENGNPGNELIKHSFKTDFYSIIRSSSEDYKESVVTVNSMVQEYFYDISYDVTLPEGCQKAYVIELSEEVYNSNKVAFKDLIKYNINNGRLLSGDQLKNITKYTSLPIYICVLAVTEDDSTVYQTYAYKIEKPEEGDGSVDPIDPLPKTN